MRTLLRFFMGAALLALVACSNNGSDPIYNDFQSCVDFGYGCNTGIYNTFVNSSSALIPYAMENGVIQGAVQLTGGLVYYQNFNGCENNSTINTWNNGAIKRYFPVTLPNNGGLACLDTYALIDPNSNFNPYYSYSSMYAEELAYSELHMYNFRPEMNGYGYGNSNVNTTTYNFMTKSVRTQMSGSNSGYNNAYYPTVASLQATSTSARLLIGCDLRAGQEGNPHCRSNYSGQGTCIQPPSYWVDSGYFGLCVQ